MATCAEIAGRNLRELFESAFIDCEEKATIKLVEDQLAVPVI
jgi:hypothetical protein